MKKLIIFFISCIIVFSAETQNFKVLKNSIRLYINNGISYIFPITTDYNTRKESFFLDVPLGIGLDFRSLDWLSFYIGVDFLYAVHSYVESENSVNYNIYLHNFFIRIPFMLKFYLMTEKDDAYSNFYLGLGNFLNFWPVSGYYITNDHDSKVFSGNCYQPDFDKMPPGKIYTPVNIGIKLALGNHYFVSDTVLLGIEFYFNYLFLPYLNGYYFNINYNKGNAVILDFYANVGILFSFGLSLRE